MTWVYNLNSIIRWNILIFLGEIDTVAELLFWVLYWKGKKGAYVIF